MDITADTGGLFCQRWKGGRQRFRPAGETAVRREFEVAPLEEAMAKAFVETHHYSGSFPACRVSEGIYWKGKRVGVAVGSHPTQDAVLTNVFPVPAIEAIELGRFVLLHEVPAMAESMVLAEHFRHLLRRGIVGVVMFSDPMQRKSQAGTVVFGGHIGTIYQASICTYLGRSTPRTQHLLPSGKVLSERTISKLRGGERGWRAAVKDLVQEGAPPPRRGEGAADWWQGLKGRFTRTVRHPGSHRYAFALDRSPALRRHLARLHEDLGRPSFPRKMAA